MDSSKYRRLVHYFAWNLSSRPFWTILYCLNIWLFKWTHTKALKNGWTHKRRRSNKPRLRRRACRQHSHNGSRPRIKATSLKYFTKTDLVLVIACLGQTENISPNKLKTGPRFDERRRLFFSISTLQTKIAVSILAVNLAEGAGSIK